MTITGALAATAAVFAAATWTAGSVAFLTGTQRGARLATRTAAGFGIAAMALFIAAIWTEALT
ncbi:hypothetical protein DNL40_02435 [Xylanimonas oleitrophica]|uniref:Uncharacterized protein n=1 Tax=Xylanimonas oleitrophica TaxID=2607479 RepID=A0A2W5XX31_9MICO|nr:hypothetical protein [Xylanimonas oleitrophica]PZR55248.1 hypothetical protein DNL40_02435 [Xylanimonas oleitrophica]